ncbi:MAG: M1 family metallopeptidase [Ignavibacterium sp.]|nr:M1 family metallopeptidase [Ignavibacterium sp.]
MSNNLLAILFITFSSYSLSQSIFQNNINNIDVIKYHLVLDIDFNDRSINAENKITVVKSNSFISNITLDFNGNFSIDEVKSGMEKLSYLKNEKKIEIDISSLRTDTIDITISYRGKPMKLGFNGLIFAETKNQKIVQTINQPTFASTWFPCNDNPSDKALLEIEIINDSDFVSISNGKLIDVCSLNKRKKYHYKTFYPISTHLIGFYSSNYSEISDNYRNINDKDLKLNYFIFKEDVEKAKVDLENTKNILKTFENLFGEYPFIEEKYSVSEILLFRSAIENQTLVGISKDLFTGKKFHQDIFIHEAAHSWWGNAVGVSSWKDVWLSEAFATYSEALYNEFNFGKTALNSYLNKFLLEDISGRLYNPENLFSKSIYFKGAWVLNMIRNILSDSVFFRMLKDFYHQFRYKTISTTDFKNFLENYSGKNFSKFFDDWIFFDNGIISCEYSFDNDSKYLTLIQKNHTFEFYLEMKIVYEDNSSETICSFIDKKENRIFFNSEKKIKTIVFDPFMKLLAKFEQSN